MARQSRLHWSAPFWLLFLVTPTLAANNFNFYPQGAQPCLEQSASKTSCSGKDASELNPCLCSNTDDFITNSASCLGTSHPDFSATYSTMQDACSNSNTPISLSKTEWNQAGKKKTSSKTSTTKSASKPTSTSSSDTSNSNDSSNNSDSKSSGLSTGATIGIAVGASMLGMAIVAGLGFWWFRRYRRRQGEAATPMLPQHEKSSPNPNGHGNEDGVSSMGYTVQGTPSMMDNKSPAPSYSQWGSPSPAQGYSAQFTAPAELPHENAQRFEMEGSQVSSGLAVEMPGSEPGSVSHPGSGPSDRYT